jgi:hypothetical protein
MVSSKPSHLPIKLLLAGQSYNPLSHLSNCSAFLMSIPISNRPPAVPKGVVWFGIMLTLSLACLGLLASYLVQSLNGDYQEIVGRQLPALAIVRKVSQANATGRRLLETLPSKLDETSYLDISERLESIRAENTVRLETLERLLDTSAGRELMHTLRERRGEYRDISMQFMKALSSGVTPEEHSAWREHLSVADGHYVSAQDALADYCSFTAETRGEALTHRSRRLTGFFLLVAAWPLVLAVGSFLSGLVSTLVFFFRHRN